MTQQARMNVRIGGPVPSIDEMLAEAKAAPEAAQVGAYLTNRGVVRQTAKGQVRGGEALPQVVGLEFAADRMRVEEAVEKALALPGVYYVSAWLNEGQLSVGDDIMIVVLGADIRDRGFAALQTLLAEIKNNCVLEREQY